MNPCAFGLRKLVRFSESRMESISMRHSLGGRTVLLYLPLGGWPFLVGEG